MSVKLTHSCEFLAISYVGIKIKKQNKTTTKKYHQPNEILHQNLLEQLKNKSQYQKSSIVKCFIKQKYDKEEDVIAH